jgi:hypothetical protein
MGDDCGAPPFFDKGALDQIGRAPVLVLAWGHCERVETGVGILQ